MWRSSRALRKRPEAPRRFTAWLSLGVVSSALALGHAADAFAGDQKILRFGIDATGIGTGDPHRAASRNDRAVVDMIFNGLLRYKPGQAPAVEPDLAENIPSPDLVGGRQVWTFRLRRGVLCHPGPMTAAYELTADDVVYSLRRAADPERSSYAGEYSGMSVARVDDYTVKLVFEKPISSILFFPKVADYAGGFVVCAKAVRAMGDQAFAAHPVGTGPFMFDGRDADGRRVRLAAHRTYFRGGPRLDGVHVSYMPNFDVRDSALRNRKLDVIFGSEKPGWFKSIGERKDLQVDVFGVGQVITIHLNTKQTPLNDVRVRKAIAYALNRDTFRSLFAKGVVENVYSPVPAAFLPGGLTREDVSRLGLEYRYDRQKAQVLLAQAGYADGFALKLVTSQRGHYLTNYQSLRDQLKPFKISIDLEVVAHRTMHKRIRADENGIVIYVAWRPNADVFLTRFFHSHSIVVSGQSPDTNFSHYDQIDRLIEAARLVRKPGDQVHLWKQAQIKILEDAAAYPLHYVNLVYARGKQVDYGHPLKAAMALYPQFTEKTQIINGTVSE
jgi:peptide/nickel transport system substrate-binding protein